jgi:hypothetical protein
MQSVSNHHPVVRQTCSVPKTLTNPKILDQNYLQGIPRHRGFWMLRSCGSVLRAGAEARVAHLHSNVDSRPRPGNMSRPRAW